MYGQGWTLAEPGQDIDTAGIFWLAAGCFAALAHDLRTVLRLATRRTARPGPASGGQPSAALDTLGHRPALPVTLASVDDRREVGCLAQAVQADEQLDLFFVDANGVVNVVWVIGFGARQGPVAI